MIAATPEPKSVLGYRAKVRLVIPPDGVHSTILRLLAAKHGEWLPYVVPGAEPSEKGHLFPTKVAARAELRARGFKREDTRLARVVKKPVKCWALAFRIGGEWQTYRVRGGATRAELWAVFTADAKVHKVPVAIYGRLRKRWVPSFHDGWPHVPVLWLDLIQEPPGYHLARVECRVEQPGATEVLEIRPRRGGDGSYMDLIRGAQESARARAKVQREAAAASATAATGEPQEPIPRGILRTKLVWKRGPAPRTQAAACTARKRFDTYKAGYAAAAKSLAIGRGRMQVQPCGICQGFHLARWRPGKDGNTHRPVDSGFELVVKKRG